MLESPASEGDDALPQARVSFFLPDPSLRGLISTYYVVEPPVGEAAVKDLLHPEWGNIRLVLDGAWRLGERDSDRTTAPDLFGPSSRALPISGEGGAGWGIGLLPAGWAAFIPTSAADLADKVAPLASAMGEAAAAAIAGIRDCASHEQRARLLDAVFLARLPGDMEPISRVQRAHAALMLPETVAVEDISAAIGFSGRQAQRYSLRVFGFPPKLLLQRQRFLRTLAVLRQNLDRPWADLIDERYYDQSHLVRDFHRFMGMAPSAYFALPREMLEPAAIARVAGVGQSLQGLQPPAAGVAPAA
jgi:methylphosphotriester-DNA--protein-cysteine methyltransferase